jgi:hypothetical protein
MAKQEDQLMMQQLKNALVAVALAAALAVASPARAYAEPQSQSRTFKNDRGQEIGRSITRGSTTVHKDAMGREIGRSERKSDGTTNYYSNDGRMIGSTRERR